MDRIFGILVTLVISTGGTTTELPVKETANCENTSETLKLDEEMILNNESHIKQDEQH
jgi:hypothetical protein